MVQYKDVRSGSSTASTIAPCNERRRKGDLEKAAQNRRENREIKTRGKKRKEMPKTGVAHEMRRKEVTEKRNRVEAKREEQSLGSSGRRE